MNLPKLRLKKNEDKRLKGGHLWVFSNEIDTQVTPLTDFAPGDQVIIESAQQKPLGIGYLNPNNLLCARLINRSTKHSIDKSFFVHRFNIALALRERIFQQPFYRLVYGESDGLPGLIIDRFGDHFVIQITTAGMEALTDDIVQALQKVTKAHSILLRNDSGARKIEGLPSIVVQAHGTTPEQVEIVENDTRFIIHPHTGQKTGWFYDHRQTRKQISNYVQGQRVLDVFSYIGAFGIQTLKAGAKECWSVDISAKALDELEANAELNQCAEKLTCIEGDALNALQELAQQGEKFDVVIVDPPAFIKRKKDYKPGLNAYRKINEAAMRLLNKDSILLSASCSMHLQAKDLLDCIRSAARHIDRNAQVLEQCHQGPDHPIHPAISETEYIKGFITRVTPTN
ncbi:MAG: class I SAM-dependent rRNA methyltransferase [Gammaproteobacteria bacterium]|nr:class I SAM-dependent rRNA methyltransferase [Gammaproteobacteria bacterium]